MMQALEPAHRINTACEKLAVSRATLYRMVKAGTIEIIKVGKGSSRVTDASLRKLLMPKSSDSDTPKSGSQMGS